MLISNSKNMKITNCSFDSIKQNAIILRFNKMKLKDEILEFKMTEELVQRRNISLW